MHLYGAVFVPDGEDMNFKTMICLTLGVASAFASASFELVMVADPTANKIHRFDGPSGAYLGSFGALNGFSGPCTTMVVNQNRNEVVVNQGTLLRRYNYNTGQFIGLTNFGFGVTQMSLSRDGQSIYEFNNTNVIRKLNANTLTLTNTYTYASGLVFGSGAEANANFLVCQETSTGNLVTRRVGFDLTLGNTVNTGTTTVVGQMTAIPSTDLSSFFGVGFSNLNIAFSHGIATGLTGLSPTSSNVSAYYSPSPDTFSGSGLSSTSLTACGAHQGMYFGGKSVGNVQGVYRFDPNYTFLNKFGEGIIQSQVAIGSVLAPEPGTMLALAAGLSVLLRRRKS